MSKRSASFIIALAATGILAAVRDARAQADVNPPLPNVMLLVDSSGSMEFKSSEAEYPECRFDGSSVDSSVTASEKSRWIEVVEVLTGSIQNYQCQEVDRRGSDFIAEYSLSTIKPYDYNYKVPYHRPVSGTCTPGPGSVGTNVFGFEANAINYHEYNNRGISCTSFAQSSNGLLDTFLTQIRFGLMTFDSLPDGGLGYTGTAENYLTGMEGQWSYFMGSESHGRPANCQTDVTYEVGARNAAAPPWEGRMVAFGAPDLALSGLTTKNEQIQKILVATRPYGATPIAGMLDDARAFWFEEDRVDPLDSSKDFGPRNDPYIEGGCRKNAIVLLSDGEPNTDLRPYCTQTGNPNGECPYDTPEEIAADLAERGVDVFVVGFAVSEVDVDATTVACDQMSDTQLSDPSGVCATNPGNSELQACCVLNRIASEGGTDRARFASTQEALRLQLADVLGDTIDSPSSRTLPVFASASAGGSSELAASFRFFSAFNPRPFDLWRGVLQRQRWKCETLNGELQPVAEDVNESVGDDFAANVNSGTGDARRFYSVLPDSVGSVRYPERSIRPRVTSDVDGAGVYGGTQYTGTAETFVSSTPATAMSITSSTCTGLTADQCRDRYLRWTVGLDNGTSYHRCATPDSEDCNLIGDIYHSTPRVIGIPSEGLRDDSYERFTLSQLKRPVTLFTSTNDGFFHAFKVASNDAEDEFQVDTKRNNELWAFVPPAVLPLLPSQYPGVHQLLLDGVPVVKDVVALKTGNTFVYERTLGTFREGTNSTWRTVLVQSFGGNRGGYFAVDVTDPEVKESGGGPTFLWQLTTDADGNPLFGESGGTPLITTLFYEENQVKKEVAVAVLPGGRESKTGTACNRNSTSNLQDPDFDLQVRTQVNCYGDDGGRSLTIVRLDTGEIIRTFRRDDTEVPAGSLRARVNEAPLDSPITGEPVAFPGATGAVADKIFVGDIDGTLWRVNVASTNPAEWTMRLFFDGYSGKDFDDGQPIATPPILSTDDAGNVTIAFSTGDQEILTADAAMNNYVWSLTENLEGSSVEARVNWYWEFDQGERVAGPMTLFNGSLFFSSFTPVSDTTDKCASGSSTVWAMDYIEPNRTDDKSQGGEGRLPAELEDLSATWPQSIGAADLVEEGQPDDITVFGVTVAQLPTCVEEVNTTDGFFGSGTHTSFSTINPGKFQLVMQTGRGGSTIGGGDVKAVAFDLESPTASPRIDSWASIIE